MGEKYLVRMIHSLDKDFSSLKGSFTIEANSVRKGWLYGSRYKEETKKGRRIFIWASSIVLLLVISAAIF